MTVGSRAAKGGRGRRSGPSKVRTCATRAPADTLASVRLWSWIRLLALVVWLPATSHCRLAALPALEFLACDHGGSHAGEPAADESVPHDVPEHPNGDGDACSSVESGTYRSEDCIDVPGPEGGAGRDRWLAGAPGWCPGGDSLCSGVPRLVRVGAADGGLGRIDPSYRRRVGEPRAPSLLV